jgi:hypothetical protein
MVRWRDLYAERRVLRGPRRSWPAVMHRSAPPREIPGAMKLTEVVLCAPSALSVRNLQLQK